MSARMYLWGLSLLPHLGSITIRRLVKALGDESRAFWASVEELRGVAGINPAKAEAIVMARSKMDIVRDWERLNAASTLQLTTWLDKDYPWRLLEISDPPPILYYQGDLAYLDRPAVAVVGRRRASPRGLGWARRLGRDLGAAGLTVVSGLALGIDAAAHTGALETGKTAAVLGTGLDQMYPKQNRQLAQNICLEGVLVTSFPPGTPPLRGNFPARNRIISGLSIGVIVVEAAERSGSLITASMALDQNRDVYAIPGDPRDLGAAGPNQLIQEGAKLIRGAEDVLEEMRLSSQLPLPIEFPAKSKAEPLEGIFGKLLGCLHEPLHLDDIALRTDLPMASINSALMHLELAGLVEELARGVFQRVG
ncbi:MAG: DNA-protecting protein DprA [Firmicutes bacterium]|nr:DNA-protecting protein DprA [Bacillota bacterium]